MAITGCLVKKNADQTAANYTAAPNIAWDAEVYDSDAFHDNVTANTRITIPSTYNGRYGVLTANVSISSFTAANLVDLYVIKNSGLAYIGFCGTTRRNDGNGQASTSGWLHCRSGPVLLATGDIFESQLVVGTDTSITVESESSFGIEILPATVTPQSKVLCKLSADLTGANYSTPTAIPWDGVDTYDTDGSHDPSSNNTKLIIPSLLNAKYVIVRAQVHATSVTTNSNHALAIRKGGSLTYDGFGGSSQFLGLFGESYVQCGTQPIQVSTGDEFEALYWCDDTSITITTAATSFGLRTIG